MSKYYGKDQAQKAFLKTFDTLTGSRNRWECWNDMIVIFATAISNAVDQRFFEQREKLYMDAIRKYEKKQQETFSELFAQLVLTMESEPGTTNFCDFLGELFMELGLGNDSGGQFFTPYDVARCMADITMSKDYVQEKLDRQGWISINDPACGAGVTLIAAADILYANKINFQQTVLFTGQDIDYGTALMCYIQLSPLGCAGYVRVGNTLTDPMTGNAITGGSNDQSTWYTPMWFSDHWSSVRAIEAAKNMLRAVATPFPAVSEAQAKNHRVENGEAVKARKTAQTGSRFRKEVVKEAEPTFVVLPNGQLSMF